MVPEEPSSKGSQEGTVKWTFLVSLETQLCHVMFFWKLGQTLEGICEVWKEYKWNPTDSDDALALVYLAMLCWSLLVVTS